MANSAVTGSKRGSFGKLLWIAAAEQHEAQTLQVCKSPSAKVSAVADPTAAEWTLCPCAT